MCPLKFTSVIIKSSLFFCLYFISAKTFAQTADNPGSLLINKIADFNSKFPIEKLYVQMDKPSYFINDTVWFKGYLVDHNIAYSSLSSRLYVEILNDSNKVVKSIVVAAVSGLTWGNISLNDDQFHDGNYTLRAYTNWMRNFGDDYFYSRSFHITDLNKIPWLVKANSVLSSAESKDNVKVNLKFTTLSNIPVNGSDLKLELVSNKKILSNSTAKTMPDGTLNLNLPLPDNAAVKNLSIIAQDKLDAKKKVTIPVIINRAKDIDLQFMPESGYLVAGLPISVGFKAIGEDGNGIDVKGSVFDENNNELARFNSMHNGMGKFDMVPQPGDNYTANITLANGEIKKVPLPGIKATGTLLRVRNQSTADSIEVSVLASPDLLNNSATYYLVGQCRDVVYYAATIKLARQLIKMNVAKNLFPTGVVHFTLFNSNQIALNERLAFINHADNLKINIETDSKNYAPHDSIPLHISVHDAAGKPMQGSFSISVIDNSKVKNDHKNGNMVTSLLLTSDLKGYVEDPEFYLEDNKQSATALDALLLTQGWVGYNWKNIKGLTSAPQFAAESEYTVSGRVTNLLNKPLVNSSVFLLSTGKMHLVKDTITNAEGHFTFRNFPMFDTTAFVLSARNAKGKTIKAGISIDNAKPVLIKENANITQQLVPWYVTVNPIQGTDAAQSDILAESLLDIKSHQLKVVNIKGKGTVNGSDNVNGAGNADQIITQTDLEKLGKLSLYNLLQQNVKYFRTSITKNNSSEFFIKDKLAKFVIDGVDLDKFYDKPDDPLLNDHFDYLKQYLDYISAEDIAGIEVSYSMRYNMAYDSKYLPNDAIPTVSNKYAYIEITTRSGNGPFVDRAIGVFVYKPVPLTQPKEFYSPRYTTKTNNTFGDIRSTVYWAPFILTNKNGQAEVSFYAADRPSVYTVTLEGTNLKGQIGSETQTINVQKDKK